MSPHPSTHATENEMNQYQITTDLLRKWSACADGYRWFCERFPQGCAYHDVITALNSDSRFNDVSWLVRQAFSDWMTQSDWAKTETDSTDKLASALIDVDATPEADADGARIGSSGYDARIVATGENSVVAAAARVIEITLGENGCAAIPYYDGVRARFAVAYVGENGIKAGVKYQLNAAHEFVEAA